MKLAHLNWAGSVRLAPAWHQTGFRQCDRVSVRLLPLRGDEFLSLLLSGKDNRRFK